MSDRLWYALDAGERERALRVMGDRWNETDAATCLDRLKNKSTDGRTTPTPWEMFEDFLVLWDRILVERDEDEAFSRLIEPLGARLLAEGITFDPVTGLVGLWDETFDPDDEERYEDFVGLCVGRFPDLWLGLPDVEERKRKIKTHVVVYMACMECRSVIATRRKNVVDNGDESVVY